MDRVAAAKARLSEVVSIAEAAKHAGPPCRECRYRTFTGFCGSPAYSDVRFNPAQGTYEENHSVSIDEARSETGICGPEGLLFESQPLWLQATRAVGGGLWKSVQMIALVCAGLGLLSAVCVWLIWFFGL